MCIASCMIAPVWDKLAFHAPKLVKTSFASPLRMIDLSPNSHARRSPSLAAIVLAFLHQRTWETFETWLQEPVHQSSSTQCQSWKPLVGKYCCISVHFDHVRRRRLPSLSMCFQRIPHNFKFLSSDVVMLSISNQDAKLFRWREPLILPGLVSLEPYHVPSYP